MPSGPIRRGLRSVGTVPSTMVRGMAAALLLALTAASCSALSTVAPHDAPVPVPSAGPWSVVCPRPQHDALQGCRAPIPLVVAAAGCGRLRLRGGAGATDDERTRDSELCLDGHADIAAGNHAPQPSAGLLLNKSKRLIEDHLLLKKKEKERFSRSWGKFQYMFQIFLDAFCFTLFIKGKSRDSRRPRGAEF